MSNMFARIRNIFLGLVDCTEVRGIDVELVWESLSVREYIVSLLYINGDIVKYKVGHAYGIKGYDNILDIYKSWSDIPDAFQGSWSYQVKLIN